MSEPLPRHMGLGGMLKTVAKGTGLSNVEVKAVLDELLSIALERAAKGNRIHVPLALLRAVRGGAARSQGRRPSRSWRRRYIVIDNKIKLPPPPPKPSPRAPLRILNAATSQRLKPSLRLKPPPPHAIDLDEVVPSVTEEEEKEQRAETRLRDVDSLMACSTPELVGKLGLQFCDQQCESEQMGWATVACGEKPCKRATDLSCFH